MDISIMSLILRFLLGGSAVVASTILARSLGGKVGGIFAAFPAVYLAALISVMMQNNKSTSEHLALLLSKGAVVGMSCDIVCAILSSILIIKYGWGKGLLGAILAWCVIVISTNCLIQVIG